MRLIKAHKLIRSQIIKQVTGLNWNLDLAGSTVLAHYNIPAFEEKHLKDTCMVVHACFVSILEVKVEVS